MAARLLFGASVAFVTFFMTEGGCREGCENGFTNFAGYNTPIYTSLIVDGTNTVKWTLLTSTGTTLHLGTCYGTFNCSTSDTRISELRQSWSESVLTFSKNAASVRGELICEETLTNGTVRTGTFHVNSAHGQDSMKIRLSKLHDFIKNRPNVHLRHAILRPNTGCNELCWSGVVVGVLSHIVLVIFIVLFVWTRSNQLLRRPEYNTSKQPLLTAVGYQTYTNPKLVEL
ncbi:uncharacterized protein [Littorina saxatilis]|uniref:uncharacterized protein isoform X2 n=1 Tax=Littorina saxatilis TaxID=31220 RepID=UPI0038B45DD7